MSVDYSCLFPTGMLNIGLHPQKEMEADLCWAYNRWVTEKVLPEADGRCSRCCACRSPTPDEALRHVETFGHRKDVGGFMVTTVRTLPVHDNAYMKIYRAIEERGLVLSFHSGLQLERKRVPRLQSIHRGACARFLVLQHSSLHQLGGERAWRSASPSCR